MTYKDKSGQKPTQKELYGQIVFEGSTLTINEDLGLNDKILHNNYFHKFQHSLQ